MQEICIGVKEKDPLISLRHRRHRTDSVDKQKQCPDAGQCWSGGTLVF